MILTRYQLRDLMVTLAFSLTVLSMLFLLASTFRFLREDVPMSQMLDIIPYVVPVTLPYTFPVSLLLAVTMTYGRMAADNELVAIRNSGLHPLRLYLPAAALALVLSGASLWLQEDLIPRCHYRQRELLRETAWAILDSVPEGKPFNKRFGPVYFHADRFEDGRYKGVVINKEEPGRSVRTTAREAEIKKPPSGNNRVIVELYDASLAVFDERGESPLEQQTLRHTRESIPLFGEGTGVRDLTRWHLAVEMQTMADHVRRLDEKLAEGTPFTDQDVTVYKYARRRYLEALVEHHQRWVLALAPLAFVLVGMAVPVLLDHPNRLVPFGVAFGLVLVLFFLPHFVGAKLAEDGKLPAWLGVWTSLAIVLGSGGWLTSRSVVR